MKLHQQLQNIKAITFDLDDTLYDNAPVIKRAEQAVLQFIQRRYPKLSDQQLQRVEVIRQEFHQKDPDRYHDVSFLRWHTIEQFLLQHGCSKQEAHECADVAMQLFFKWRSQIDIPVTTHKTLKALQKQYPLAVITNGNSDPAQYGLSGYFTFMLFSGRDGRSKPYPDMYQIASQKFQLPFEQILHVGDDPITDIQGAAQCGMQTCWINSRELSLPTEVVPHVEISKLDLLLKALL